MGRSLLGVKSLELSNLRLITVDAILVLVVHVVVETVGTVCHRVLLVVLVHYLQEDVVVDLETPHFDLVLPDLVVKLHVIEDGVDEALDIWVLVAKEL